MCSTTGSMLAILAMLAMLAMCCVSPMTEQQAERIANICLGLAAVGAAYYVLRRPDLRRLAWGLVRNTVVGGGPAWLAAEALRAWNDGGTHAPIMRQPAI